MKNYIPVLAIIGLMVSGKPVWSQQKDYSALTTLTYRFSFLKDSLLAKGVDTVIYYSKGNTGCPSVMPPTAILYWEKEGKCHSRIIITKSHYNHRKRQTRDYWEEWTSFEPYPLNFLVSNAGAIRSDTIEIEDAVFVIGAVSEILSANIGTLRIKYNYFDGSREGTRLGYKKGLIDHFRSFFLDKMYRVKAHSTNWK